MTAITIRGLESDMVIGKAQGKRRDSDADFDTMRENMKPDVHIQITDCKLALKEYIRVSASKNTGGLMVAFAKTRVIEHLAELKRLCALPKQAKASDGKLPLMTIKLLLEAGKLHAMHIANNRDVLEKLHSFGSISRGAKYGYCILQKGDTVLVDNILMVYTITETVVLNSKRWYKLQNSAGRQLSARKASSLRKVI